jgi:hypothetical protein
MIATCSKRRFEHLRRDGRRQEQVRETYDRGNGAAALQMVDSGAIQDGKIIMLLQRAAMLGLARLRSMCRAGPQCHATAKSLVP